MGININGNGNRVAGRDYFEVPIKPCPRCETRVIEPSKTTCNHCRQEIEHEKLKGVLSILCVCIFLCWGFLLKYREDKGLPIDVSILGETLIYAVLIVGFFSVLWQVLSVWLESRRF